MIPEMSVRSSVKGHGWSLCVCACAHAQVRQSVRLGQRGSHIGCQGKGERVIFNRIFHDNNTHANPRHVIYLIVYLMVHLKSPRLSSSSWVTSTECLHCNSFTLQSRRHKNGWPFKHCKQLLAEWEATVAQYPRVSLQSCWYIVLISNWKQSTMI